MVRTRLEMLLLLLRADKMLPAKEGGGEKKERDREGESHTEKERENTWEGSCATSAAAVCLHPCFPGNPRPCTLNGNVH